MIIVNCIYFTLIKEPDNQNTKYLITPQQAFMTSNTQNIKYRIQFANKNLHPTVNMLITSLNKHLWNKFLLFL